MKKLLYLLAVSVLSISLVACGGSSEQKAQTTPEQPKQEESKKEEPKKEESPADDTTGKEENSEIGKRTIVKSQKGINIKKTSGPFEIIVTDIQVSKLETNDNSKSMFNNKDEVTIVTIAMTVENKDKKTNSIYPDQGKIVTNTKEQKDVDLMLSDHLGGDFIGEVVKKGNIICVLDSKAEDITNLKYFIDPGHNSETYQSFGEKVEFDFKF